MKRTLPALLLLAACATATAPPKKAPEWTTVPAPILNAFCARLRGEGVARDSQILVLKMTQPLITASSIDGLGQAFFKRGNSVMMSEALNAVVKPIPLTIPTSGSCTWLPIDAVDRRRDHERIILELSTPFVNPYSRGESGLFARMSVGGQAAEWFWIPVAERNGEWAIGMVLPMELHEE